MEVVSGPSSRCGRRKRIVRIARVNKAGSPAVVQQFFRLLDHPVSELKRTGAVEDSLCEGRGKEGMAESRRIASLVVRASVMPRDHFDPDPKEIRPWFTA